MEGEEHPLLTLQERVATIEERTQVLPEMREDIKSLLAFMNRANGAGTLAVKITAFLGVLLGAIGLGLRVLGM